MKVYDVDVAAERRRAVWLSTYQTALGASLRESVAPALASKRAADCAQWAVGAWDEWEKGHGERQTERAAPSREDADPGAPEPASDPDGDYLGGGD